MSEKKQDGQPPYTQEEIEMVQNFRKMSYEQKCEFLMKVTALAESEGIDVSGKFDILNQ